MANTVGIFTTDRQLVIRTWDSALEELAGISAQTARGKALPDLFPEIRSRGLVDRFHRVLQTGAVEVLASALHGFLIERPLKTPIGSFDKMQQTVTIAPLRAEASVVGLIVTVEDVTARLAEEHAATALADEDWRTRKKAVETLAEQRCDDAAGRLLASLRSEHSNPAVLNSALQVLHMSGWDVVKPLAEFLRAEDTDLRIYAALALGEQGTAAAIPPLLEALNDPDENVRYHAIEALGKLRASEATEPLLEIVQRGDFFLAFAAIDALALIGDPQCTPVLLELLDNDLLKTAAAETLGKLGEISALEPLAQMLNTGGLDERTVVRSLAAMYDRYQTEFAEGGMVAELAARYIDTAGANRLAARLPGTSPDWLRDMVLVMGWLQGEQVDRALIQLLSERTVRREVMEALTRQGRNVVGLVIEQLKADDVEIRRAAVMILGKLGSTRGVEPLVRLLSIDPDVAIAAADALARIGDRSACEALLQLLGHEKASVRQAAVGAINSLGHPDTERRVVELLRSDNAFVRESAVRIAGYFAYPTARDLLLQRCDDPDENVQRAAIEHLPYLDDPRVLPILISRLRHSSPGIRAAAAQALGEVDDERSGHELVEVLNDGNAWVRYYAVRSIARKGLDGVLYFLGKLAREDESPFVRIAAIQSLGSGGVEAVDILGPLAASEDPNIAKAALETLGDTRCPEAFPSILEAVHARDPERRRDAAEALARFGGQEAVDLLQWLSADEDLQTADTAIKRLASISTAGAIAALIGLLGEERRGQAAAALGELKETHLPAIARGLEHPQPGVRAAIVEVLARMKHPAASEWIAQALNDGAPPVRFAAIHALARAGNTKHRRKLVTLAHNDPDLRVRQAARKWMEPAL